MLVGIKNLNINHLYAHDTMYITTFLVCMLCYGVNITKIARPKRGPWVLSTQVHLKLIMRNRYNGAGLDSSVWIFGYGVAKAYPLRTRQDISRLPPYPLLLGKKLGNIHLPMTRSNRASMGMDIIAISN